MKLAVALLCVAAGGCVRAGAAPEPEAPSLARALAPGDRVVGRWRHAFFEGTVVATHGRLVTVAWEVPPRTLPRDEVAAVPAGLRDAAAPPRDGEVHRSPPPTWPTEPLAAGQPVVVGQTVLGRWSGGGWWVGKVVTVAPAGVTVAWSDGSPEEILPPAKVAPIIPAPLGPGALALCRWQGDNEYWPARVERVAPGGLSIAYGDGDTDEVSPQDCVAAR